MYFCFTRFALLEKRVARRGIRRRTGSNRASVRNLFVSPYLLYEVTRALTTDQV